LLKKSARKILKEAFECVKTPNFQQKAELARITQLSVVKVSNWFKNQRQRARQNEQYLYRDERDDESSGADSEHETEEYFLGIDSSEQINGNEEQIREQQQQFPKRNFYGAKNNKKPQIANRNREGGGGATENNMMVYRKMSKERAAESIDINTTELEGPPLPLDGIRRSGTENYATGQKSPAKHFHSQMSIRRISEPDIGAVGSFDFKPVNEFSSSIYSNTGSQLPIYYKCRYH